MLDARDLSRFRVVYDDNPVDEASAPDKIRFLLDLARIDVSAITVDPVNQISLDRIGSETVRLRPLSYRYHVRFYRALDVENTIKMGMSRDDGDAQQRPFRTLREHLAQQGCPHEPDSDVAPCKLGISCLIVEGSRSEPTRILTTVRGKHMVYYPGARHGSFSGGVELEDIDLDDATLLETLRRAAVRECLEELNVRLSPEDVDVIGLWRDLERCSAQGFAFVFVDSLDSMEITRSSEVASFLVEPLRKGWWQRLRDDARTTPELEFLIAQLGS
jgi:8-oxo-dGTP pyrophosphatase MutT (NUDIX family)